MTWGVIDWSDQYCKNRFRMNGRNKRVSSTIWKNFLQQWKHAIFVLSNVLCLVNQSRLTLCDPMDCSPPASSVRGSPGQNTGVGCHALLQEISTQGSNPGLLHSRWILSHISHQGSPTSLEWVAYPFSRGSSDPGIKLGSPALQANSDTVLPKRVN